MFNIDVTDVGIDRLYPFEKDDYTPYRGEQLNELIRSIKIEGIEMPVTVRMEATGLKVISGHNRVAAAWAAGLEVVPVVHQLQ